MHWEDFGHAGLIFRRSTKDRPRPVIVTKAGKKEWFALVKRLQARGWTKQRIAALRQSKGINF